MHCWHLTWISLAKHCVPLVVKRDFAGEMMDRHPELQLVEYGFVYKRDPNFPQNDVTWFLMEKNWGKSL